MSAVTSNSSVPSLSTPDHDSGDSSIQPSISTIDNAIQLPPRYSVIAISSPIAASGNYSRTLNAFTNPPRYSTVFYSRARPRADRARARRSRLGLSVEQDRNALPSASSGLQLREFHITTSAKSKPWTNLRIYGPSSGNGQKVLRFSGNDLITGSLDLNLETPQTINSINLSLRGRVITTSYEDGACTFLDLPIVSWNRNNGDPRSLFLLPGETPASLAARTKKFDGKFVGKYSWPFSFPFPETISLPGHHGQPNIQTPTPPTFLERGTQGNIGYELVLRITHGILRSDSKLHATIIYVPDIKPTPSSILRQLAYSQQLQLPGPDVDPVGWHSMPPVTVSGRLSGRKSVKFDCTLSITNPQAYTRGTIIPCHVSIRCKDLEDLDVFARPETLCIRLARRVQYYHDGGQSFLSRKQKQAQVLSVSVRGNATDVQKGMLVDVAEVERAVWWTSSDNERAQSQPINGVYCRDLNGEIHLSKELQPSCSFSLFKVSYTVELIAFKSALFHPHALKATFNESNTEGSGTVASLPVTIATLHGEGPIPIAVTKPKPRKECVDLRNTTDFAVLDMYRTL
ncbi:hypothetical protein JR316_0004606 [Psilocybe cubensis]|uniref:Arrestin-like N-terminal domain-containing protein n=2 Tax=Psilocybe cubensis TaxID=181762 RepID=A0A8H7XYE9_PSICU|nr:hypothetical protein JR316_0004606 [Psilocybe cubensis]KAH9482506.1 hypothetical protein JR316_0004606 [Psilocybe cubensis]